MGCALVVAATVMVASVSSRAWSAGGTEESNASEAKRHYEEGTKAFNLGEFARAIAEFKATYNVKPDPLLLYNIAQSYRLAGDASQALFFYKSFLRNMPGASNRKDVEAQIRRLERQLEEQRKEPSAASAPGVVPVAPPPVGAPPVAGGAGGVNTYPAPSAGEVPPSVPAVRSPPSSFVPLPPAPTSTSTPSGVDLSAPARPVQEDRPLYKKWWFGAGTAGAVLIIGSIAAANAKKGPSTQLGLWDPIFTK
jgi:hypothetical protein